MKRDVIVITDGDQLAAKAAEKVANQVGGRLISCSAGNPTPLTGVELVELIKMTPQKPIIVLLDDRGHNGVGKGEEILIFLAKHKEINLIGVVAVASNVQGALGTPVDFSIMNNGAIHKGPVNKLGEPQDGKYLIGDTVSVLPYLNIPLIVGIGDVGKMEQNDSFDKGAPITLKAVEAILENAKKEQSSN